MTATIVITAGYVIVLALLAVAIWRVGRKVPKQPKTAARPAPLVAVLDTEPGINLALHDECELLWAMPAYAAADPGPDLTSDLDWLLRMVRDEQQKEAGDA